MNLKELEAKLKEIVDKKMHTAIEETTADMDTAKKEKPSGKKKSKRGIETLFRLTSKNHIELSAIADNKANIMISINAIIISIVVSALMTQLQQLPVLVIPTVILLSVCLGTIIFATISTRPKVTTGKVSSGDIENERGNLLFFGNFHEMTLEEYEWGMKKVLESKDYLYGSLTRDIYYLGLVLQKKYKFLRISYNIFMYGLIIAVLSYFIAFTVNYYR